MRAALLSLAVLLVSSTALGLDEPHDQAGGMSCPACHLTSATLPAWYTASPDPGDPDTVPPYNRLCRTCHAEAGPGPAARTHSSFAMTGVEGFGVECRGCHDPHVQRQARTYGEASFLVTGLVRDVTATTLTAQGASWVPGAYAGLALVPNTAWPGPVLRIVWNGSDTLEVAGALDPAHVAPGDSFGIGYGKAVRDVIGGAGVRFFRRAGESSFADGDATIDGVCEVCHPAAAYHESPTDHRPFAGTQCVLCHQHRDGFRPSAASLGDCLACHDVPRASRRQVVGTGGDFSLASHHVVPAAGSVTADDCQVCHDVSTHGGRLVLLKDADTGQSYPYNPANPVTAEAFCLSCHDANGANGTLAPFSDGRALGVPPYRASADIEDRWARTYGHQRVGLTCLGDGSAGSGCHTNGHGSANVAMLAKYMNLPNTTHTGYHPENAGDYELCFDCHAGYPGVTKEDILGVKKDSRYDWDHDWGFPPPYYVSTIVTEFRDRYDEGTVAPWNDRDWFSALPMNLHFAHLADGTWTWRDGSDANLDCTGCHSVHGSSTPYGWVWDEIQWGHTTGDPGIEYGAYGSDPSTWGSYPTSCGFNCHEYMDAKHMWFAPAGE